jgi:hypothetical protein
MDPDWYATQGSEEKMPSPGLPDIIPLQGKTFLIGRSSPSRGINPEIECSLDTGVSRKHAELSTDGTRWWVEDLGSANGTFVGNVTGPLPALPIAGKVELSEGQAVYVGAWTKIYVRRATDEEIATFAKMEEES